jgi:hypothetical protein
MSAIVVGLINKVGWRLGADNAEYRFEFEECR